MLFTSTIFIALLLCTFVLYYLPFVSKFQVQLLIISSLIFYAYADPVLLLLLLFSAAINIITSYYVAHGHISRRKLYATSGVVINLLIIIFFKYSPLIAKTFALGHTGIGQFLITIPLPIGISFYTFEGISLLVDVYSNKYSDRLVIDRSWKIHINKTLFFISFFPHLIAGPVLKADQFYPQIGQKSIKDIDWDYVLRNLIMGYFLKMVVADNLNMLTFWIKFPYFKPLGSTDLIALAYAYAFQLFADFAGYSLIALGLAKLFGYTLMDNFNFPFISTTFAEFRRRWHISLSLFLKEYLYIPLGGNRKGKTRTYVNLMITMAIGGLWHGAGWNYVMWGLLHGTVLAGERLFINNFPYKVNNLFSKIFMCGLVITFFAAAALLFKLPLYDYVDYFRSIRRNYGLASQAQTIRLIAIYSSPVVVYHLAHLAYRNEKTARFLKPFEIAVYAFMLFMITVNSGPAGSFVYFQF